VVRLVGRIEEAALPEIVRAYELMAAGAPIEPLLGSLEAEIDGRRLALGFVVEAQGADQATFADQAAGSLDRLLDAAVAEPETPIGGPLVGASVLAGWSGESQSGLLARETNEIVDSARQVGQALAGLHSALVRPGSLPATPFTSLDRRALYQGTRTLLGEVVTALRNPAVPDVDSGTAGLAESVIEARAALDAHLRVVIGRPLDGLRIPRYGGPITASRVHRDGGRHVIGIPDRDYRPAVDRARLRSPLIDVAAILVSLRAIALRPLFGGHAERRGLRPEDAGRTEGWARAWWAAVGSAFFGAYVGALSRPALLPSRGDDRALLLDILLAELTLEETLAITRAGQPPDPTALVALLDLSGGGPGAPA
jgi:predicted trehalose synthase